ncbi:unnamed protein product [Brugia timori]|uniref:Uncharacterized protein n=1 Tax=Brugia timori TaxID=42155 RepID=A0A0R3R410_9BILA|nr:unnamed protein product [Brugia timori]
MVQLYHKVWRRKKPINQTDVCIRRGNTNKHFKQTSGIF